MHQIMDCGLLQISFGLEELDQLNKTAWKYVVTDNTSTSQNKGQSLDGLSLLTWKNIGVSHILCGVQSNKLISKMGG